LQIKFIPYIYVFLSREWEQWEHAPQMPMQSGFLCSHSCSHRSHCSHCAHAGGVAMTEAAITEAIMKWLRARGAYVIKTYGGPYRRGLPDLIGVYRGRALALEVKRPGGRPTPLQEHELGRWAAAGA